MPYRPTRAINYQLLIRQRALPHCDLVFSGGTTRPDNGCDDTRYRLNAGQLCAGLAIAARLVCPVRGAIRMPHTARTWKLRIPWKLFILIGGFISAG